ncbi:BTAD domain-containing putative transcriptional regulator [Streptomyces sp. NPDC051976]|uniref:AfsR/SARP family transcriptional regulator n=1 Tax=Streptomyces sp. NPDC051976 TaxID=3154947 RepID=UPI00344A8CBE
MTEAWDADGAAVPLGGGRLRAALAVLALGVGRAVPPEALIGEVWAGEPPTDAEGALQALISRLRRTLGRDAVVSEPGGYRLAADRDAVDLYRFERMVKDGEAELAAGDAAAAAGTLTAALALWRGPALADLPDRTTAAARPEALRQAALRHRFEADLALDRAADALPDLREAVAAHPLDEPFRAQLIRALSATGRDADALAAYDEARTVLAETLGTDPGPELRALHARLLAGPTPPAPGAPAVAPTRPPASNLRARLTSFVGRETDLRDIRQDLAAARLVTLTGPGGSGKTRLAQEAAEAALNLHPDGVWLAELAPLDDPSAVPHAVLNALGRRDTLVLGKVRDARMQEAYAEDPLDRLLEHCAQRSLLLVLDNCEHLIGAAADLAAELLAACPRVTVLATSREPLGVPGEIVRPVEPLPPPTAYRLFTERAATARPGTAGTGEDGADSAAVREICRRLDGLPLAIELAAARLRALSPRQIADRLDDRFRLLTSGSRTVLPRQQTLRAVVDWSWDLLSEQERTTLRRLSVFAGGCTLSAAEAVCGPEALDTVAQLVDKSLVLADHAPSVPSAPNSSDPAAAAGTTHPGVRYRLLETIHEYAAERAAEHPADLAAAERRHTAYYRDLACTADPQLRAADQLHWLDVLETELDNIRAALNRAVETGAEPDALTTALAMGWFWWLRNYRDEADVWIERVLALCPDFPERPAPDPEADPKADQKAEQKSAPEPDSAADDLFWQRLDLRMLQFFVKTDRASEEQWDSEEYLTTATRLSAEYGRGGPRAARFPGLLWPFTAYLLGGVREIHRHTEAVVANCRVYGGDWEVAAALMFRTHVTVDMPGGVAHADADWDELQRLNARLGDRWMRAQVHGANAEIEVARGQYDAALADFEAAHRLGRELGAYGEGAFLLARMGELAHRRGDDAAAAKILNQAADEAERYGVWDARTYIRYLQSVLLLRRDEVRAAREMWDLAMGQVADGTPPPVFRVLLLSLEARIIAAEGDPEAALRKLAEAARLAVETGSTEPVVGGQFDAAADVLVALDDPRSATWLSAAASAVRGALPRTVPELAAAGTVERWARATLGEEAWAAAGAAGAVLSRTEAVAALEELVAGRAEAGTGPAPGE